jgi:hypothetical protein
VINTKDSSEVFTYDLSATATPQWLNNERLLFSSADHGLFELNAKTQSASTVFSAELIKISSFSVVGDKILFTAYSDRDLTRDPAPDGFIVHLDQEAKNNNALLFALPHEDEDIKITNLWDTIYASSAKSPGVMRDAQGNFLLTSWRVTDIDASTKAKINNYLKDKVPNYTDYKIVYGEGL